MRNLLALFAFALITFAALGWYRDWYKVQSVTTPDGNRHIDIDIHSKKIGDDIHRGTEKIQDAWEKHRNPASGDPSSRDFFGPIEPGPGRTPQPLSSVPNKGP